MARRSHTFRQTMKRTIVVLLLLAGCGQARQAATTPAAPHAEMRTIENSGARPRLYDPPPMLTDEAPPPKPRDPIAAANQIPLTDEDERIRARLPFAPAIAMDPVDGSKVSIRATTPTLDLKGRTYYFSSEENKRLFQANPDQFTKGVFSKL